MSLIFRVLKKLILQESELCQLRDEFRDEFPADLVTFTGEILNGKLHFFVQCMYGFYLLKTLTS